MSRSAVWAWVSRGIVCVAIGASEVAAADMTLVQKSPGDLSRFSIEELANIEISSVSKRSERLGDAPAAVFVITREEIRRSGATSIPEILRLAPNLQVARVDSSQYAITARGFNGTAANKLQVLIDGRSVYTPLFSGVFWDVQDVLIEDLDRIEVISGPGGGLYGSNAVNGVINIITRKSGDTPGALVSAGVGTRERGGAVRYGGALGEHGAYRLYAKGFGRDATSTPGGQTREDEWKNGQFGFRTDFRKGSDGFTLQGDTYRGEVDQRGVLDDKTIAGANVLARWTHTLEGGGELQVQVYYDRTERDQPGSFREVLETYDLDVQHRFRIGARNAVVLGGGYRFMHDRVRNSPALAFLPATQDLSLANIFGQDTFTVTDRLHLTLGVRVERNSYTGFEVQPSVRLAWKPSDASLLWGAVSRAVRTPSRIDREFVAPGSPPFRVLVANHDFKSEDVIAYELGLRIAPFPGASLSISPFYNVYDRLRSVERTGVGGQMTLGNKMEGETYGVEAWGEYRVFDWWRLAAGYNYLEKRLRLESGSRDVTGVSSAGNDPPYQVSARSSMTLPYGLELDVGVRAIGPLPNPRVSDYVAVDARLGWRAAKGLEISLSGFNLDGQHVEFGSRGARSALGRAFYGKVQWAF